MNGCGATWTTASGRTYTCTRHPGGVWHSNGIWQWDGAGQFMPTPDEPCRTCGEYDHTTAEHSDPVDAIPNDLEDR